MTKQIKRHATTATINDDDIGLHPVLKRVFAARQIQSSKELNYSLIHLLTYHSLANIDHAVDLLIDAIQQQKHIVIIADYDTDGATSCALAIRGLSLMGADYISYIVPNRFEHGYGLSPDIVDLALAKKPDLLITVDNGISSISGVQYAKDHGLQVIITDHHLPSDTLPNADAILNPCLAQDNFPSKCLAGVGVMFYLLIALRAKLQDINHFSDQLSKPNLSQFLDLVALGTVADVVPLDRNNRILVAAGLARMRQGQAVAGIKALLEYNSQAIINTETLGYYIAPRLNAAGRLTDMSLGIACLLTDDQQQAQQMAQQLDTLNCERREIQKNMQQQAIEIMDKTITINQSTLPNGIALFNQSWHQGIVGILAGKIKDKYNRPTIMFAADTETHLKGSARSISTIHIRDLLEDIARNHDGLIINFGGHAMAAGLTIKADHLTTFQHIFDQAVAQQGIDPEDSYITDGELGDDDFCIELADAIEQSGPWGQAFTPPLFDGIFEIMEQHIINGEHLKMKLRPQDGTTMINAIAFNCSDVLNWVSDTQYITAVYQLKINDYRGRRACQLIIDQLSPVTTA